MFVHLRARSHYSFLYGLTSPEALAQRAAALGMPAIGLVDRHGLTAAIEFIDACQQAGVKPILGLELDIHPPQKFASAQQPRTCLTLLALDLQGWANLCRLSSLALAEPVDRQPHALELHTLGEHSAGLLCLSGGVRGLPAQLLAANQENLAADWLADLNNLFPGRLYAELQRHTPADQRWTLRLQRLAVKLRLPYVATHEIAYLDETQAHLQRLASAMRLNTSLQQLPSEAAAPPEAYFLAAEAMQARFSDLPVALENSLEITGRCVLQLPLDRPHFPEVATPPGLTAHQWLQQEAYAGARRLYGEITPALQQRLDHELQVIGHTGFTALFLVMQEILAFARRQGIPYASRGSASSSLVAHCLDITTPDPVGLNLYFERFLNPARATPPDIDTDLCSRRRDEVIHFVYQHFGRERVAMVCTVNRFRRRSALREVAKAYSLPSEQIKSMADSLPWRWRGPAARSEDEAPYAELAARYTSPLHQAVFRDATAMIGLPHHLSIHPGGMVIAPGPLQDLAPTQFAAKGVAITQFDLDWIERLGLVKIDLLGIRGLTVLGDVVEAIQAGQAPEPALPPASTSQAPAPALSALDILERISPEDPLVADLVEHGRTIGCFQIESPGMRATLKEIRARSPADLMVALALYRPGPLTGGLKDAFVRRHIGLEPEQHLHEALRPLLSDTYGVILYQEQVLRIAHELAGLSLADADLLRRAMSHFDPGRQMQTLMEKFIAGAETVSGVPPDTARRVWDLMAAFAGYGFPKAHAASYAQVAWRSAWCKVHFPAQFMAAVLANWGGYYGQRVYLMEARRLGLGVRPPHVNYAHREFSASYVDGNWVLFMGLDQVRELGRRTQERILRQRPFHSLEDFLVRVDPRPQEAENLARSGALHGFGAIPAILERFQRPNWSAGQLSLFAEAGKDVEDWGLPEKVAAQEAILGVGLDAHPLELVADRLASAGALSIVDAITRRGQTVRVAGMRQLWRRSRSARGNALYFLSLEDLEGMLEVVISAEVYRRFRNELSTAGPYIIEGSVEIEPASGEPVLRAQKVWRLG